MTQYPVDSRARQPRDSGNLGNRSPRRLHLLDGGNLLVSDPPPAALLRAAPGLSFAPGGVNMLSPDLGFCAAQAASQTTPQPQPAPEPVSILAGDSSTAGFRSCTHVPC